jgi:hypothetical protein
LDLRQPIVGGRLDRNMKEWSIAPCFLHNK